MPSAVVSEGSSLCQTRRTPEAKAGAFAYAYERLEDVENREQKDPNDIDEMPVQPGAF